MKVLFVFGTRPEAVKLSPVINRMRDASPLQPVVCNTAQHVSLLQPVLELFQVGVDVDLGVMSPGQALGGLSARILERLEAVFTDVDPAAVVTTMEVIAERFAAGQSAMSHELAETVGVAEPTVTRILDQLVDEGILHRIDDARGTLVLARPPESITAEELIEIGFQLVDQDGGHRRSTIIESLRQAQLRLAANTTLANLLLKGDSSAQPQS